MAKIVEYNAWNLKAGFSITEHWRFNVRLNEKKKKYISCKLYFFFSKNFQKILYTFIQIKKEILDSSEKSTTIPILLHEPD